MSLISRRVWVFVLVAGSAGCHTEPASHAEGRLDVVIRPDGAAASSRPLQGSLVLRDPDGHAVERLTVGSVYETHSVALREGAYALEWQPQLSFDSAEGVASAAGEAVRFATAPVRISAGRVTTLNVRAALATAPAAEIAALDEEIPSVAIRIARH
jgi:hypothetical protein